MYALERTLTLASHGEAKGLCSPGIFGQLAGRHRIILQKWHHVRLLKMASRVCSDFFFECCPSCKQLMPHVSFSSHLSEALRDDAAVRSSAAYPADIKNRQLGDMPDLSS